MAANGQTIVTDGNCITGIESDNSIQPDTDSCSDAYAMCGSYHDRNVGNSPSLVA